jgi:DNA polymerase III subunit delta'
MNELTSRTNTELFGHEEAEAALLREFAGGKLAHGWIMAGAKGTGKATLAYRFARAVLAGAPTMEMGEADPIFRRVAAGSHADLLVVEPEWNEKKEELNREISVEQAREIARFLSLTPGESQWRVVIIDSADALNVSGANAILKILEEPPPQALLLLIAHNPGKLLPTIRSRCRMLKLRPLSENDFNDAMRHLVPEIETPHLAALGALSGYAPGIALELEEQGAIELYNQLLDLLSSLPAIDAATLHAFADQWTDSKAHGRWQLLLRLILTLFERTARLAGGMELTPITPQEPQLLAKLLSLHPAAVWAIKWQQASDQFLLAESRHLDYKQVIITFFHSIASREGFQLGNTAA